VDVPLAADNVTVAQVLKQSGYHTGLIGEWNLGGDGTTGAPWNQGFDEFAGYSTPATRKIITPTMCGVTIQQTHLQGKVVVFANTGGKKRPIYSRTVFAMTVNFIGQTNRPDRFNITAIFSPLAGELHHSGLPEMAGSHRRAVFREPWPHRKKQGRHDYTLDANIGQFAGTVEKLNIESNR